MYTETINALSEQAVAKLEAQRRSLPGHFVRSMLAGMYVGVSIVLIFTIGGSLAGDATRPFQRLLMGVCFGGALTLVIFAGSELFTGSNLVLTFGVLTGRARSRDLLDNWVWTWLGNLAGSLLLAAMVVGSGLLDDRNQAFAGINKFVYGVFAAKTTPFWYQLFLRAVLANWLVVPGRVDGGARQERVGPYSADLLVHVHVYYQRLRAQHRQHDRAGPGPAATGHPAVGR